MSSNVAIGPERAARVAWRATFDEQLTRETITAVRRYTKKRIRLLVRAGVLSKSCGPKEALHDAVAATLSGEAAWDPESVPLAGHLIGVVRWKTRNLERQRARYREASLDDSRDDTSSDGCKIENEATLLHLVPAGPPPGDLRDAARRVIDEIRPLAQGDTDVIRILDAIEGGAGHGELLAASRLRPAKYRNARRRLARITDRLTEETRAAASAVLA